MDTEGQEWTKESLVALATLIFTIPTTPIGWLLTYYLQPSKLYYLSTHSSNEI